MAVNEKQRKKKDMPVSPGRPKGVPNKMTGQLKEMIMTALEQAHPDGGIGYLRSCAEEHPTAFLSLVGKVLPLQVANSNGGDLFESFHKIAREIVRPHDKDS